MNLEKALGVMETAALEAGRMLLDMQPQTRRLASRKDFLTDADLKAEEIILRTLAAEYPDIPSLSEEKGGEELTIGYQWIVDPVDGTINFFLQDDHWGVSIALAENGRVIAGTIYLPAKKQLFSALIDIAARLRRVEEKETPWENIKVNQSNLKESQVWLEWGKEEHEGNDHKKVYEIIERVDRETLYPQIRNSAVADMMMVARGNIAGYVFPKPQPVDIAAAGLIIQQAGGAVTDMEGNAWGPFSRSIVASNGVTHDELLRIIRA